MLQYCIKGGYMANTEIEGRGVIIAGGIAGFIGLVFGIADIVIGSVTGADISALPADAAGHFADFAASPLLGLYRLDALNMVSTLIAMVFFVGLYVLLRGNRGPIALLALVTAVLGTGAMLSGNAAFAILDLSGKYASAVNDADRAVFLAAAEALLARGAHGSPAMFTAFFLPTAANILFCLGLFAIPRFGKLSPLLGLAGNALLLNYVVLVTFFPSTRPIALVLAAPGGLLALYWTGRVSWALVRS